jgi:Phage head-tail joining protein
MTVSAIARKRPALGARRHVVSVVTLGGPTPDGAGGFQQDEIAADPPTWRCAIEGAAQWNEHRELANADVVQASATHTCSGRYHPGIDTAARLYLNGRRFDVQSVDNVDERGIMLVVLVTEVVDGGE